MHRRNFLTNSAAALGATLVAANLGKAAEGASLTLTDAPTAPVSPSFPANSAFADLFSLHDVEALARTKMDQRYYEYYKGGAADELTVRWNQERYQDLRLRSRVLVDVSKLDTSVELLGRRMPFPILLAPASNHRMAHPEGELATARGASMMETTMVLSSGSNTAVEDVARVTTHPLWFQLYVTKDRGFAKALVQRAETAGAKALCVTVDNPVDGPRNREQHARPVLPPGVIHPHYVGMGSPAAKVTLDVVQPAQLAWKDIEWLQSFAKVPVLVKGIMNPLDAEIAVKMGVAGIMVSNHGGRSLDTQPATIEVLPKVADLVAGRVPIIVDGGIRRGTDVVKALALGATAVQIGRPYLYGLAVGGAEGVAHVIKILRQELMLSMANLGRPTIASIDRSVLWDLPRLG